MTLVIVKSTENSVLRAVWQFCSFTLSLKRSILTIITSKDALVVKSTYHDLGHCEEYREQCAESSVAVINTCLTLQSSSVHPYIPVGQFIDKLHEPRHDGVQTIR